MMLQDGLYEKIITQALYEELQDVPASAKVIAAIDKVELAQILSQHVAQVLRWALEFILDKGQPAEKLVEVSNQMLRIVSTAVEDEESSYLIEEQAQQLLLLMRQNYPSLGVHQEAKVIERPESSLAITSLFTGAMHEPQMYSELKREILMSDRIDMLVSFIKWSGLRLIIDDLRAFVKRGGELRVITTSYMGATDLRAVEELRQLERALVKVSYDTDRTRLHAKAYVFYRNSGYSTAYVGSSNLSRAAISSGLEWNVKVTAQDLPDTMAKIEATFETYWSMNEFVYYEESQKERLARALKIENSCLSLPQSSYTIDVMPYAYQQEILDKLQADREIRQHYRNLVVAATGTGKTVISALDYRRFKAHSDTGSAKLLFVAHRREILEQSIATFRAVLKDDNFGELYVGQFEARSYEHLFVSIQTFSSKALWELLPADYYDYIIIDEFHHAAAKSYQALLKHFQAKILLGLTATPERMDGRNVLDYFDGRISAEIRLPEAIERKLLSPFQYFGVTDIINLSDLRWTRGGYDVGELNRVYTMSGLESRRRARHVLESVYKYVNTIDEVKGLGFCVSVEHAKFMAEFFLAQGVPSIDLNASTPANIRSTARSRLERGELKFIFVVDLFNEGVDIPEINTVLFLRPTESLTVFLQQLGRGLRISEDKDCLTVLDFIGQAHQRYNFEEKFRALLANTNKSVQKQVEQGFTHLPKGCYVQLEKVASEYILSNIKASYSGKKGLASRIAALAEENDGEVTLAKFLNYYHLAPREVYQYGTFSALSVLAEVAEPYHEVIEPALKNAFLRLSFADSRRWIRYVMNLLDELEEGQAFAKFANFAEIPEIERRMFQMFYVTVWNKTIEDWTRQAAEVFSKLSDLASSPIMLDELRELLRFQYEQIDFVDRPLDLGFDCPLDLHCSYTRDQLLVAMDYLKPQSMREGVKWLEDKAIDVFLVTLNKSDKDFSATTLYKDYSINELLFHWQSQSTTSDSSPTGQRYINHRSLGSSVLLFVREFRKDAYTFLGKASYVKHVGSRPMSITWKLEEAIPAKFLKKTNKLVVG